MAQWKKGTSNYGTASSSPTKGTIEQRVADVPFRARRHLHCFYRRKPRGLHVGHLEESNRKTQKRQSQVVLIWPPTGRDVRTTTTHCARMAAP